MFSYFLLQKIVVTATSLIKIFVCKSEPVLPLYNTGTSIGKRCLDGDMDSVFFV